MIRALPLLAALGILLAGCDSAPDHAITGHVSLDPSLEEAVNGDETVFVFARAENGPNMPLALVEMQAGDLPAEFTLTNADAMGPAMSLSEADQVHVVARVSKSGQAQPQSGDLEGQSETVTPGTRDVEVIIDQRL